MSDDPRDYSAYNDDARDERTWTPRRIIYLIIAILIVLSLLAGMVSNLLVSRAPPPPPPTPMFVPSDRV
jgi:hypothetical protein